MIAIKVQINDTPPVIGGADDLGVLSVTLTCVGKLGDYSHQSEPSKPREIRFRLGGLTSRVDEGSDEHLEWLSNNVVQVGDKITLEIVETSSVDLVVSREPREENADYERKRFEHCKNVYLAQRSKFEPDNTPV